jgi:NADH-ubiquinone oxidoreductase chain 3
MTNITFFLIFIPILAMVLLLINYLLAPHLPDKNKDAQFECGFSSFTQMSRLPFSISFFIYALLFLLFDLEILLVYPYVVSAYNNSIYGLVVMLVFFILLTIGFVFELGKKALQIDSRQHYGYSHNSTIINKLYYKFNNLCYWFIYIHLKYPNLVNFLLTLFVSISIQMVNCAVLYCDSSPESIAYPKDEIVVIHSNSSDNDSDNNNSNTNTNTDKGKGKATYQGGDIKNLKSFPKYGYNDADWRRHFNIMERLGIPVEEWEERYYERLSIRERIIHNQAVISEQQVRDQVEELVKAWKAQGIDVPDAKSDSSSAQDVSKNVIDKMSDFSKKYIALPTRVEESIRGLEETLKRKAELYIEGDEDVARKLQKSFYGSDVSNEKTSSNEVGSSSKTGPYSKVASPESVDSDNESTYSILSSMRGSESPNTYQKKLEVLELEFNLKKK